MKSREMIVLLLLLLGAQAESSSSEESYSLRLVEGSGPCQGKLQFQRSGEDWTEVSPSSVPLSFGDRLCAKLDCGSAVAVQSVSVPTRVAFSLSARFCDNTTLKTCFEPQPHGIPPYPSGVGLELTCSDSVRLVGGRSLCSGSVHIRDQSLNQSWTGVCDGALDRRGAEVLCRELSCGAPLLQGALSPLKQTFHCGGNESSLIDCPQEKPQPETCPTLQLTCSESVRLVGGASRCEGMLELKLKGEWRRVCDSESWNLETAGSLCRDLDCGSAVLIEHRNVPYGDVWSVFGECVKKSFVRDCVTSGTSDEFAYQVVCSGSVRLVGGQSVCSGSPLFRDQSLSQSWTGICEGALDRRGAEVLCRELGCGAPLLQGALSPLKQTFHCEGNESSLMDCPRNKNQPGSCLALQRTCSEPIRLVGGPSRCEGMLELEFRGEWRRVFNFGTWDLEAAGVVCRNLDCGSAVWTAVTADLTRSDQWALSTDCMKKASARDCVTSSFQFNTGQQVLCSDILKRPHISVSDGVSGAELQRPHVPSGSQFWVNCSVEPHYPGAYVRLLAPTDHNQTLPATNHSSHFLFTDAGPAHEGGYTCVYHLHMLNHNFTAKSSTVQLQLQLRAASRTNQASVLSLLTSLLLLLGLAEGHMI